VRCPLLSKLQCIVNFDAEIADSTFQLRMAPEHLHDTREIRKFFVDRYIKDALSVPQGYAVPYWGYPVVPKL
jgi:hypothetical protein